MVKKNRVSLIDPLLYNSTYINQQNTPSVKTVFWKNFSFINFILNILLPISIIVFVLFILKYRYYMKKTRSKHLIY